MVQIHPTRKSLHSQAGIGLVEAIIGLLVLTIVLLSAAQLFRIQVTHLALTERARVADTQATRVMSGLAAMNQSALPDVNPFAGKTTTATIADGEQVSLDTNVCQSTYSCDKLVRLPQSSGTGYDYAEIGWTDPLPTNSTLLYYRAWRVTTLDAARHLRQITVAITPADIGNQPGDPVEPLALRQSVAVQRQ